MGQHHIARADVLAREFSDVDMVGDQNKGTVAFGW